MIGIFDNVRAPSFPIEHPPFFICVEIEFDPSETGATHTFVFELMDEDGKSVLRFEGPPAAIPRDPHYGPQRVHMTVGMGGIRFERPGPYRLDVQCDGEVIGQERLPVIQVDAPAGQV